MSDRQKLLAISIFCILVGIIIILAIIINPTVFEYECGAFDVWCFDGIWTTLMWIAVGIGLIVVGITLTLILWGSR